MKGRQSKCVICGLVKEHPSSPLCISCTPYMYKKQCFPHQKVRRRKKWKENREQILNKVGYQCEMCGSKEQILSIHHQDEVDSHTYKSLWYQILIKNVNLFIEADSKREEWLKHFLLFERKKSLTRYIRNLKKKAKNGWVQSCPHCDGTNLSVRKKSTPKFKCVDCGIEFNQTNTRASKNIMKQLDRLKKRQKIEKEQGLQNNSYYDSNIVLKFTGLLLPLFYEEVKNEYKQVIETLVKEYIEMKNVKVLCKRCHHANNNGLKLCKKCKKNYHSPRYKECSQCHFKEKESKDPRAQQIRSIFNISKYEAEERLLEAECIKCGGGTWESPLQYNVYLREKDIVKDRSIGMICIQCHEEYITSNERRYIVKKE